MRIVEVGTGTVPITYASAVISSLGHDVSALRLESGAQFGDMGPAVNGSPVSRLHSSRELKCTTFFESQVGTVLGLLRGSVNAKSMDQEFPDISSADAIVTDLEQFAIAAQEGGHSVVCVTPFGIGSAKSGWKVSGPMLFHLGGLGIVSPRAAYHGEAHDGPPQAPYGSPLDYLVGLYVAFATLALYRSPQPQLVDISGLDCLLPLTRRESAAWQFDQLRATRKERLWKVGPSGFYKCADGYFYLHVVEDRQWRQLCSLIGMDEFAEDPRFTTSLGRYEHEAAVDQILVPWAATRTRNTIFKVLGSSGIPCGPALSALEARQFAEQIDPRLASGTSHAWVTSLPIREIGDQPRWLGVDIESASAQGDGK
jgi:hypothetical protein